MNAVSRRAALGLVLLGLGVFAPRVWCQDSVRSEPITRAGRNALLACDFETDDWWAVFGSKRQPENTMLVGGDKALGGRGRSLQVTTPRREHLGTSFAYKFREQIGG